VHSHRAIISIFANKFCPMPNAPEILRGLEELSNNYVVVAIIWHIVFAGSAVVLLTMKNISNRYAATLFCLPAFSVSAFAWLSNNPFNGSMFAVLGILLLVFGLRSPATPLKKMLPSHLFLGLGMIIFGLVYPHFVKDAEFYTYFYAAPSGLIPCPTLSVIIGFAIVFLGFRSKAWSITLLVFSFFYALFGIFKLGVTLDWGLLAGALVFLIQFLLSFANQKRKKTAPLP
jgi:hypothetical protein